MKYRLLKLLIILLIALLGLSGSALASDVGPIYDLFVSPDWCGRSLIDCAGATAQSMRDRISAQLAQGWDRQQIIDYWVGIYGLRVLAAPPKQGFFWTAWLVPFIVLGAGMLLLMVFIKSIRQPQVVDKTFVSANEQCGLLQERLDTEMRKRI